MAQIEKKLTIRSLGLVENDLIKWVLENPGKELHVATVVGFIRGEPKPEVSTHGPYFKFLGDFEGTNILDGTVVRAPAFIAPKFIEELLLAQCVGQDGGTVAIHIGVRENKAKQGGHKYTYTAISAIEEEVSPFAALKAKMKPMQIAAPAKTETAAKKK